MKKKKRKGSNVYIVMGDASTGKSTIVRALTGAFRSGPFGIATRERVIKIFVQIRSVQEVGMSPRKFINKAGQYPNILVTLRIEKKGSCPDGLEYIKAFLKASWRICGIVVLQNPTFEASVRAYLRSRHIRCKVRGFDEIHYPGIGNPLILPPNRIAQQIRQSWKWR